MLQAQGIILTPEGNNRKRPAGPNDAGPSKRARAGSATPQEEDEEDDVKPEVAEEQLQALLVRHTIHCLLGLYSYNRRLNVLRSKPESGQPKHAELNASHRQLLSVLPAAK